jgi:hypothetical protein
MTNLSTATVMGGMSTATSPMAKDTVNGMGRVGGAVAGVVGGAAMMGVGAAMAVGQTAANYGSYYGQAAKHEFNRMRNIAKNSD